MDDGWSVPHCRLSPIGCPVPGSVLTGDDNEAKAIGRLAEGGLAFEVLEVLGNEVGAEAD
jgi:hypothetical protein